MEYAGRSTLQTLLRSYRLPWTTSPVDKYSPYANMPPMKKLTSTDLIGFALQVSMGMEYVATKEVCNPWVLVYV